MPQAHIKFPARMDLGSVLSFSRELDYYSMHDIVTIDFSERTFFSPFAMLILAAKIFHFRKKCPSVEFRFVGQEAHPYPSHMGFFHMLGLEYGREVGEAWGNQNYLPITELKRESFYESHQDRYEELPDLIQRQVDRIAVILSRDPEKRTTMFDVLSYSIREVFRNVFEHGETDSLFFCAQYWPRSNKVEFAVVDFGIGIRKGLGNNPNFRFNTDKEAIEYCLLPSVSGKTHLPRQSDTWFNSGYGLYMTNRLARNGGNFTIASGSCAIHFSQKTKNNFQTYFPGTAIRINLDVSSIGDVQSRLSEFRRDGAEIAKTIAGSGNRPPSAMSLLLRRDYQKMF